MSTVNPPKYQSSVFFVEDIKKSKHFYSEILGQKIVADFGRNVGFEGGLSIWEKEYALSVIFEDKAKQISVGANNSEIYFECSDIDAFFEKLVGKSKSELFIRLWSILGGNGHFECMILIIISLSLLSQCLRWF